MNKSINFAIITKVVKANPNGDPVNLNRPRVDACGYGELSSECIKRKIRDRMVERYMSLPDDQKAGQKVLLQSDNRRYDDAGSIADRIKKSGSSTESLTKDFLDIRAFGIVFAPKTGNKDGLKSMNLTGPVTIQPSTSVNPISISETHITKSLNTSGNEDKKGSDTMGIRYWVDEAIYVTKGSINRLEAEKTLLTDEDVQVIKEILPKIYQNDVSAARPDGSVQVLEVLWWEQKDTWKYSAGNIFSSFEVNSDGSVHIIKPLEGLEPERIPGW